MGLVGLRRIGNWHYYIAYINTCVCSGAPILHVIFSTTWAAKFWVGMPRGGGGDKTTCSAEIAGVVHCDLFSTHTSTSVQYTNCSSNLKQFNTRS